MAVMAIMKRSLWKNALSCQEVINSVAETCAGVSPQALWLLISANRLQQTSVFKEIRRWAARSIGCSLVLDKCIGFCMIAELNVSNNQLYLALDKD